MLVDVESEEGPKHAPKQVRIDGRTGEIRAGDPEIIDLDDARAMVAGIRVSGRKSASLNDALKAAGREVPDANPVDVRLGGSEKEPAVLVTLAGKDAVHTVEVDVLTGRLRSRAEWRSALREVAEFLSRYESLNRAFDPKVGEMYAPDAVLRSERRMPSGERRKMEMSGARLQAMLAVAMPMAKATGDRNSYRDVRFRMEGTGVRVRATRYSELKKYESPIDWLFARDAKGQWRIVEENSVTQP
jgi:ketosteroid isomerase-like protein